MCNSWNSCDYDFNKLLIYERITKGKLDSLLMNKQLYLIKSLPFILWTFFPCCVWQWSKSLFYKLMLSGGDVASNRICQVGKKCVFSSLDGKKKKSVVFLSLVVLLRKSPKQCFQEAKMYVNNWLKFGNLKVRIISRLGRKKFRSVGKKFPIPSVYVITGLFEQSLALYNLASPLGI